MNAHIIGVVFPGNTREYYFKSYIELAEGDMVIVDTRNGFAIATVSCDCIDTDSEVTKEVVAKVDVTAYNERRARETRIAELREKMDARVQESYQFAVYEMLAKNDPELAHMFDELKQLI